MKSNFRGTLLFGGAAAMLYSGVTLIDLIRIQSSLPPTEGFAIRALGLEFSPLAYGILHGMLFLLGLVLFTSALKAGKTKTRERNAAKKAAPPAQSKNDTAPNKSRQTSSPAQYTEFIEKKYAERRAAIFPKLSPGFTLEGTGRTGYLYLREGERMLEVYWEQSGVPEYDLLLTAWDLAQWCFPVPSPLSDREKERLTGELKSWLRARNIRFDL